MERVLALALLCLLLGCPGPGFDARGADASVGFSGTIAGEPADAARCAAGLSAGGSVKRGAGAPSKRANSR